MNHLPSDDYLELQRVQRELAANRRKISELEELINEVPAIYERKFDQKLQPLVEDVRLLSERNQVLREQLRHALSPAAADTAATPASPATPDVPAAANDAAAAPKAAAPSAPSPPAPTPTTEPPAAARTSEELARPAPAREPQRQGSRNRPALWRTLPAWLARWRRRRWPSLRWARASQPPRPVLLALLAAAGVGVVGGIGLQQWRLHTSGTGAAASRAAGAAGSAAVGGTQAGLTLQIRSSSDTWLDVRTLRGASLYAGLFRGERRFPIGQGLRLNAGKPELVTIRVGDGPERGLGHPGWWVWHSFAADGRQRVASE